MDSFDTPYYLLQNVLVKEVIKDAVRAHDDDITTLDLHRKHLGICRTICASSSKLVWVVEGVLLFLCPENELVPADNADATVA